MLSLRRSLSLRLHLYRSRNRSEAVRRTYRTRRALRQGLQHRLRPVYLLRILCRSLPERRDHPRLQFRAFGLQPGRSFEDEDGSDHHLAEAIEELSRRIVERRRRFGIQRSLTILDFRFWIL